MNKLSFNQPVAVFAGLFIVAVGGLFCIEPSAQDPGYHLFADTQPYPGLLNSANRPVRWNESTKGTLRDVAG